jgi:hypothetical protein
MFKTGETVQGYVLNARGEDELVTGTFLFRTNDPEEYIQDIVIREDDGNIVYIDEQNVIRPK